LDRESIPFPVTVIGVTVVEALGFRTVVPTAATPAAENAAARRAEETMFCLILMEF
jgi:hypothetical protein